MMVRTQITLEREMQKRARQRAKALGMTLSEYIRKTVARDLEGPRTKPDISSIFDLGSSPGSNIARNKDIMIAEAIEASRKRYRKTA